MLRTGALHSPLESLTPRFDARVSPYAGGLLQRVLVPPLAGLPPASHRELPGHTVRQLSGRVSPARSRIPLWVRVRVRGLGASPTGRAGVKPAATVPPVEPYPES
jgi:hypothetical protein